MKYLTQNHFNYGLLMCLVVVACLAIMELTGNNESFEKNPLLTLVQMLMPLVIWYMGITKKKQEQKGKLTFKEGVTEGFKISLAFGLLSPFVFMLYYVFINPEIVTNTYNQPQFSFSQIIVLDMALQLVSAVIFGTLYSAIISFFVKSKK